MVVVQPPKHNEIRSNSRSTTNELDLTQKRDQIRDHFYRKLQYNYSNYSIKYGDLFLIQHKRCSEIAERNRYDYVTYVSCMSLNL